MAPCTSPPTSEANKIAQQIPPIAWGRIEGLFQRRSQFSGETPGNFTLVRDPDDRKFVALACATGAILVSSDEHLLKVRQVLDERGTSPRVPVAPEIHINVGNGVQAAR